MTRSMTCLSVILTILISVALLSCVPKVVTPEINRASYVDLKDGEPECTDEITALEESPVNSDELVLDALFCYRKVWKHWENSYRVLDAQLESMNETRE